MADYKEFQNWIKNLKNYISLIQRTELSEEKDNFLLDLESLEQLIQKSDKEQVSQEEIILKLQDINGILEKLSKYPSLMGLIAIKEKPLESPKHWIFLFKKEEFQKSFFNSLFHKASLPPLPSIEKPLISPLSTAPTEKIKSMGSAAILKDKQLPIAAKINKLVTLYQKTDKLTASEEPRNLMFIKLEAVETIISYEIERIKNKNSNDKRVGLLSSTLKTIKQNREYFEGEYAASPDNSLVSDCHKVVKDTIKFELLNNNKLDFSFREKFVRGLLNALNRFSFSLSPGISTTEIGLFRTKTQTQENIEVIQDYLKDNKPR
ncbi:Uncharacterised protein [Legionella busanensis]|uniref:Uncharacterized protein n=1 Tax=Legionella busanensis TaxID=190655 RepID=A0A378K9N0_9GAMM|nr:hypothetical protein [Legionella busanensis]STX81416.1 Uncharacterised protein [Legionella busanensis]